MSPLVFNGLLYGGDMAPPVKQGAVDEPFRLKALLTHAAVNGEPMWQTPPPRPRTVTLTTDEAMALTDEIDELRDKLRFWRYCYLTVCAQFLVVAVAAVWGWTR